MLTIKNLTKTYGTKRAVDDISIHVESGSLCAFIGHNGAGKTTALKAIAGIINYDEGIIEVDGKDIQKEDIACKRLIGYLPDNPDMYEHMTGIDYLNFIADIFNIDSTTRKERIEEYAKRLTIYDNLKQPIGSYSHGMKQKIALVSVLIHKPKLYLFDEPFVGLDPSASHALKTILKEECKKGSAILFSTHVLEVAEKLCSHLIIIKNGKIMGQGTMKELKGDESLENLFLELEKNKNEND